MMERNNNIRKTVFDARAKQPIYSRRVEQALLRSIGTMRDYELELFKAAPGSTLGLRVASLRTELARMRVGLPLRLDSVLRVLTSGVAA